MKRVVPSITNAQQKYLLNEISKHHRNRWDFKRELMPPALERVEKQIKTLQRQIDQFNKKQDKLIERKRKALDKAIAAAKKEVYFGTPKTALAALNVLQKQYPAKG